MRISVFKRFEKYIVVIAMLFYIFSWSSTHLFIHKHVIGNDIVTHSHPYSQGRSHDHSQSELNLIAQLCLLAALVVSAIVAGVVYWKHLSNIRQSSVSIVFYYTGEQRHRRGPPVAVI